MTPAIPAPISVPRRNGTTTAAQSARLRLVKLPSRRSSATLYTAHPSWSHSPDGAIRRLFPAGPGRAWLATWANGELDQKPLNGASADLAPPIHWFSAEQLPPTAPVSMRRLNVVMHVSTPSLWDALSTAITAQGPCPHAARTLARRWSQQLGEVHIAEGGALYLAPDPMTVLTLSEVEFDAHGASQWRVPLRAAAAAHLQHACEWLRLDNESLARAFTALEGVDGRTARAAVADFRADFTRYPLPHPMRAPRKATDRERHTFALFALTAKSRKAGCPMTVGETAAAGTGRQSAGGPCLRAVSAADDAVRRAVPTECAAPGVRPRVSQESFKVVVVGAEGVGKSDLVRSASDGCVVRTDETRSTPPGDSASTRDGELPTGWGTTTTAMDFGLLTLDDGALLRLYGTPGAQRFQAIREGILAGADLAILLLDAYSAQAVIPLLDLADKHNVPVAVAVRQPAKGPLPASYSIRSRLGLDDRTPVLAVDPRDPRSARRMLADATEGLRRQAIRLTVLRLLANGLSGKGIAVELGEPPAVVRALVDELLRTLGTTTRIHAAARGVARRLVTADDLPHAPAQPPRLSDPDRQLLSLVVVGNTEPAHLAIILTRDHQDVRSDMERLRRQFNAADDVQLAAHAVLLDAVPWRVVDDRLPDTAVTGLLTGESGGFR